MTRTLLLLAALLATLVALPGCGGGDAIRIGAKPFVEQEILAKSIEAMLAQEGITTRPTYHCDDTFDCERALQTGLVDVMVEYSGTAYNLLGESPPEQAPIERLDELYEPLGIRWLAPLGFDNGYVWLVSSRRADTDELARMSDLAKIEDPLRVAVPSEFLRRPRDGLAATGRRYGMSLHPEPLVLADPYERLRAVISGRADAAVVYGTDPATEDLGLTALTDDLAFLPEYAATIVVRTDALDQTPGLAETLGKLEGTLDAGAMRKLNHAVAADGESPGAVAQRFLESAGLSEEESSPASRRTRMTIATGDPSLRETFGPSVLMGVRSVFPGRAVRLEDARRGAADAVANGHARFGIVGVESFFRTDRRGRLVRRDDLQALAVLGQRMLHLVVKGDGDPWSGRVGVVKPRRRESAGAAILAERGVTGAMFDDAKSALAALGQSVDAVLIAAPLRDPQIATALADGARLADVAAAGDSVAARRFSLPYLRPAKIPAGTYRGQDEPVETLSAQVVLAGPSAHAAPGTNAAGPAGALPGGGPPSMEQLEALAAAVGSGEAPDPSVPSAFTLGAPMADRGDTSVMDTVLNLLVIAFCAWLVVIVGAPTREA